MRVSFAAISRFAGFAGIDAGMREEVKRDLEQGGVDAQRIVDLINAAKDASYRARAFASVPEVQNEYPVFVAWIDDQEAKINRLANILDRIFEWDCCGTSEEAAIGLTVAVQIFTTGLFPGILSFDPTCIANRNAKDGELRAMGYEPPRSDCDFIQHGRSKNRQNAFLNAGNELRSALETYVGNVDARTKYLTSIVANRQAAAAAEEARQAQVRAAQTQSTIAHEAARVATAKATTAQAKAVQARAMAGQIGSYATIALPIAGAAVLGWWIFGRRRG